MTSKRLTIRITFSIKGSISDVWQFKFFGPNLPKRGISVYNRKNEHRHGIMLIRISVGTKFQFKQTI